MSSATFLLVNLLMLLCVLVLAELGCDETEFLLTNGTCFPCHVCGPGEELSKDCGFGEGADAVCVLCQNGSFSTDTDVNPCRRCTQCHLLNRQVGSPCSSIRDALCGHCLPGFYELRGMSGEVEPSCVPCYGRNKAHQNCFSKNLDSNAELAVTVLRENTEVPQEESGGEGEFPIIMIGSLTACVVFLFALLFWAFLLTSERFKKSTAYCPVLKEALLEMDPPVPSSPTEGAELTADLTKDSLQDQNLLLRENDSPSSIVINVTANIKPPGPKEEAFYLTKEGRDSRCSHHDEMDQNLRRIWEKAEGQSVEALNYDLIQDLSLLLDTSENRMLMRRLGLSLGVPPQVVAHLNGFQDLYLYLSTSTYTLLPQLAQAAALLPCPEAVAMIHNAVMKK
ncbi:uncharacterized protein ACB058_012379 [Synchiropus picturatus]